jgi:hypothetical protein
MANNSRTARKGPAVLIAICAFVFGCQELSAQPMGQANQQERAAAHR